MFLGSGNMVMDEQIHLRCDQEDRRRLEAIAMFQKTSISEVLRFLIFQEYKDTLGRYYQFGESNE